jgi:hypothetical protein
VTNFRVQTMMDEKVWNGTECGKKYGKKWNLSRAEKKEILSGSERENLT